MCRESGPATTSRCVVFHSFLRSVCLTFALKNTFNGVFRQLHSARRPGTCAGHHYPLHQLACFGKAGCTPCIRPSKQQVCKVTLVAPLIPVSSVESNPVVCVAQGRALHDTIAGRDVTCTHGQGIVPGSHRKASSLFKEVSLLFPFSELQYPHVLLKEHQGP